MITMVLEFQMKLNNRRDEGKGRNQNKKKKKTDEKQKRKYFHRKQYSNNDKFLP